MRKTRIGTQMYGLEKELSESFSGTFHRLHEMGYEEIEPYVTFLHGEDPLPKNTWTVETLMRGRELAENNSMVICSIHVCLGYQEYFFMDPKKAAESLIGIYVKTGIRYFVISGMFQNALLAEKWGKYSKEIADALLPYDCVIVYHNHNMELNRVTADGKQVSVLEYFMENAGPNVMLQLDIGWAAIMGDEMEIVKQYQDRICSLHIKDFYMDYMDKGYDPFSMPEDAFAPIGDGAVRIDEYISMRDLFPHFNGSIIVDMDKCSGDSMKALEISFKNVKKML